MAEMNLSRLGEPAMLQVLEVARELAAPLDLPVLLGKVIDAGRAVLDADRGSVFLYDEPAKQLYIITGTGLETLRFGVDQGIAGECARSRQVLSIPDCYADARFNQDIDRKTGYRTKCLISVPLIGLNDRLVGVMQLLNAGKGRFDAADERIALALAGQAAVAIQRAQLIEEQKVKLKLERDLALAREIQQGSLPRELPRAQGYDLATFSRPAEETGGDIFDVVRLTLDGQTISHDDPVMLLLGDATGHGVGPAISVTQVRAMFRMALRLGATIDQIVRHIDEQLEQDLGGSRFVTAFVGRLDPRTHEVTYVAPGQAPLLHVHARDGRCESRAACGLPLGLMPGIPRDVSPPFKLEPGDVLALLTDGFYECMNEADDQFGEDRVGTILRDHPHESASQLLDRLVRAIDDFRGSAPQADDLTAILIRRPPA
ncbi:MAG: SpoIIE family protein phosphatase [Phycisphaeraceae bacterium]|nr:SpoIIE family protein phosphatase [Phycisphaeraceae bacterium]